MGFRIFDRLFRRRGDREYHDNDPREDQYYDGPPETEHDSFLVDHHFIYPSEDGYEKNIREMQFQIEIENTTEYPMGNIRVEFNKKVKLGKFGKPKNGSKLLDPGEKMVITVPFTPKYQGGSEEIEFELLFFDFHYKVEESILIRTDPLKVVVPKFQPVSLGEDDYRYLMADLFRWVLESEIMKIPPEELFKILSDRLEKIGFKTANEMVNKGLYRGIRQMVASDKKGRKWAVQLQVIGKDKESKFLLYTYGERPLSAYNLSVKVLLKIDRREELMRSIK